MKRGRRRSSIGVAAAVANSDSPSASCSPRDPPSPPAPSLADLNQWLRLHPRAVETSLLEATSLLTSFVDANRTPQTSPNLRSAEKDDLSCLIYLLAQHERADPDLVLAVLSALKVLLRKESNRQALGEPGVVAVIKVLKLPRNAKIAGEGSNAILNMCYESSNVELVIRQGGLKPLISFLVAPDPALQASASGALQSICFQDKGRVNVRELGGIQALVKLLRSADPKVLMRAVGALHNISSDPQSIVIIREAGGIPRLIQLLSTPLSAVCGSAAGALQNLSRENLSRRVIYEANAAEPLADLLFGADVQAQVCAAGALLNIIGPELGDEGDPSSEIRTKFKEILSSSIALGVVYQTLSDRSTDDFQGA